MTAPPEPRGVVCAAVDVEPVRLVELDAQETGAGTPSSPCRHPVEPCRPALPRLVDVEPRRGPD